MAHQSRKIIASERDRTRAFAVSRGTLSAQMSREAEDPMLACNYTRAFIFSRLRRLSALALCRLHQAKFLTGWQEPANDKVFSRLPSRGQVLFSSQHHLNAPR